VIVIPRRQKAYAGWVIELDDIAVTFSWGCRVNAAGENRIFTGGPSDSDQFGGPAACMGRD